ncbi:MAG TPA: ribonuclease E inhibitor RraB [Candidatus Angelobacter sp.]|nr:ribonuclease E inhibitor RraB [Candidatus Angelobacter sp.]
MFEGIRSLFGRHPKRSESDLKIDAALASAESLDHYFFFSDHADAEAAAERLHQRGWSTQSLSLHGEQQKWLLHMRQTGKIEDLKELQTELDLFADEHHGEYDGWKIPDFIEPE